MSRVICCVCADVGDETLGQDRGFAVGEHPPDDVTAEDIKHDVQVGVRPLQWVE